QGAAVRARQLSGVEVQARELDARVLDRLLQGVELGLLGVGGVDPGPPQLDRGEARRGGGRGALQEREFREEDRQVDVEALVCESHGGGAPFLEFRIAESCFCLMEDCLWGGRAVKRPHEKVPPRVPRGGTEAGLVRGRRRRSPSSRRRYG